MRGDDNLRLSFERSSYQDGYRLAGNKSIEGGAVYFRVKDAHFCTLGEIKEQGQYDQNIVFFKILYISIRATEGSILLQLKKVYGDMKV